MSSPDISVILSHQSTLRLDIKDNNQLLQVANVRMIFPVDLIARVKHYLFLNSGRLGIAFTKLVS